MFRYPYGDSQQLNLDWLMSKIKSLNYDEEAIETLQNDVITLYNPVHLEQGNTAYRNNKIVKLEDSKRIRTSRMVNYHHGDTITVNNTYHVRALLIDADGHLTGSYPWTTTITIDSSTDTGEPIGVWLNFMKADDSEITVTEVINAISACTFPVSIVETASGAAGDLEQIANALISLTYNTSTAYRRYDYAFLNGKLYRCLTDTSGVFNPTAWQEALIGDDLAVLTRWINAIDAAAVVDVKFDTSGTNGKIQQKYHDQYHDVVEVDYTPVQNSKRPLSSNAGYELNGAISDVIEVSTNNTQSNGNKLWIDESADSQIQVPTWAEMQALEASIAAKETLVDGTAYLSLYPDRGLETGNFDLKTCIKKNGIVLASGRVFSLNPAVTANGYFFRLPQGYWPVGFNVRGIAIVTLEDNTSVPAAFTISPNNGYVEVPYSSSLKFKAVYFVACYPL